MLDDAGYLIEFGSQSHKATRLVCVHLIQSRCFIQGSQMFVCFSLYLRLDTYIFLPVLDVKDLINKLKVISTK